jgi:hypothetical protein
LWLMLSRPATPRFETAFAGRQPLRCEMAPRCETIGDPMRDDSCSHRLKPAAKRARRTSHREAGTQPV